jgi:hypothetical protein
MRFTHPFHLGHDPRELPAGTYAVHKVEDVYQGASGQVSVVRNIDFVVEGLGGSSTRMIVPADLRAALQRDQAYGLEMDVLGENPDCGRAAEAEQSRTGQ